MLTASLMIEDRAAGFVSGSSTVLEAGNTSRGCDADGRDRGEFQALGHFSDGFSDPIVAGDSGSSDDLN